MDSNRGFSANQFSARLDRNDPGEDDTNAIKYDSVIDPRLLTIDRVMQADARNYRPFRQLINQPLVVGQADHVSSQRLTPTYLVSTAEAFQVPRQPQETTTSRYPSLDNGFHNLTSGPVINSIMHRPPMVNGSHEIGDRQLGPDVGHSVPESQVATRKQGSGNKTSNQRAKQVAKKSSSKNNADDAEFKAMKKTHKERYLKKVASHQQFIGAVMEGGVSHEVRAAMVDNGIEDEAVLENVTARVEAYLKSRFQAALDIEKSTAAKVT